MAQSRTPAPPPSGEGDERHQIVIVGGGAGGVELACQLSKRLKDSEEAAVTLVDGALTHLWKPLLHEVAAGTLDSHGDAVDFLALARQKGFRFRLGAMEDLDRDNREIQLAPISSDEGREVVPRRRFRYDTLVLAVGSTTNDLGVEGVLEHSQFLDHRDQADRFQETLFQEFLHVQTQQGDPQEGQLDVVIVGGGATGVELAAELNFAVEQAAAYGLDRINPKEHMRIHLIEAADRLLPALPERVSAETEKYLRDLGIEIHTGDLVTRVTEEGVETRSGKCLRAGMKVWTAGIKAPDFLADLDGLETNRINQVVVGQTLQTTRDSNIFALGDCAECLWPERDTTIPPRAQAAHQQATLLEKSLLRRLEGKSLPKFVYKDYGSLINLSQYNTVGRLMGNLTGNITIEGFMARIAYRSLYRMHQRVLFGSWRTLLAMLGDWIGRTHHPRLKLH